MYSNDSPALQRLLTVRNNIAGSLRSSLLSFDQLTVTEKSKARNQLLQHRLQTALLVLTSAEIEAEAEDTAELPSQKAIKAAAIATKEKLTALAQVAEGAP